MKHLLILMALIMAGALAAAQAAPPTQQSAQPGTQTAQPANPGQQTLPAGQTPPAAGQQATQPPSAVPKHPPQAKNQEEFKAFQDANAKASAAETEAAANDFATKNPDSELRLLLYRKAMYEYQNANNAEKAIEMGRKMVQLDPNNPEALVMVATFLSEKTRDTDLDRDERLAEATRDAQKALQTVDSDLMLPATMPADQVEQVKKQMKGMAHGALGTVAITKKDYAAAEASLRQATQLYPSDALSWLRLAYALDQEKKYQEAMAPANTCIQTSADQPQVNSLCKAERDRLSKLVAAPPTAAQPAPSAPSPGAVPPPSSPQPKPSTPPPSTPK